MDMICIEQYCVVLKSTHQVPDQLTGNGSHEEGTGSSEVARGSPERPRTPVVHTQRLRV